jgi:hypothetical protein
MSAGRLKGEGAVGRLGISLSREEQPPRPRARERGENEARRAVAAVRQPRRGRLAHDLRAAAVKPSALAYVAERAKAGRRPKDPRAFNFAGAGGGAGFKAEGAIFRRKLGSAERGDATRSDAGATRRDAFQFGQRVSAAESD